MLKGIEWTRNLNYTRIIIEIHMKLVYDTIKTPAILNTPFGDFVEEANGPFVLNLVR